MAGLLGARVGALGVPVGVWRVGFGVYAALLATATHWPQLRIDGPVERTDLWIHFIAFGGWAVALCLAEPLGYAWRDGRSIVASLSYSIAYAWTDEGSQAIPGLGRTFDLTDLAANTVGCCLGASAVWVASRLLAADRGRV